MDGVRVLELAEGIAGPYVGKWLAGLGADVVKVEPPAGDRSRMAGPWPGDVPDPEASGLFLYLNAGKRSVTLDLDAPDDRRRLLDLVATADIVLDSFGPGYLAERGLAHERLAAVRPALVMLTITPFGLTGPNADLPATEMTVYAMSGQQWLTGSPVRAPLKIGGSQPSYQAGLNGLAAVTAAYFAALTQGVGAHIDLSMQETFAAMGEAYATRASQLGQEAKRTGNNSSAMWGVYPLADGFGGVCCLPRSYAAFAAATGMPELQEPRFADPVQRAQHTDELRSLIAGWFTGLSRHEVLPIGFEHRVPLGYVATVGDLAASEHLDQRDFFASVEHPRAGTVTYPARLWLSSEHDWGNGLAPALGEHNGEIFADHHLDLG